MAASMVRCRLGLGTCRKFWFPKFVRCASTSYYVLLPEIPPDTPETNPILRTKEYPQFSQITPSNTISGCAKLALEYDVAFGKHVEKLKDPNFSKTFSAVFNPIEERYVPMNYAWRIAKNLNYVSSDDDYRKAFQRVHPQVERAKNERWISEALYNAAKEVAADVANLSPHQRRLAETYLMEARLNGIEFTGPDKKKFMDILSNLVECKKSFRNKVMLSHSLFSHIIDDFSKVADVPQEILSQMALDRTNPSRGPWKVTLNQNVYTPFMEYCSDRMMRWNVWQALNNRASIKQDNENLSNHNIIKDIRQHRKDIANMLGYENFAQMSMETKMAGTVENVMSMIESFKSKFQPRAEEEVVELRKFAESEGFPGKLEMWDMAYWRRQQRQQIYNIDKDAISEYFPFPTVLHGLFDLCNNLFGITIQDCTGDVDTWDKHVLFFKVYDSEDGSHIADFYLDPYSRPHKLGGSWMEPGRDRSDLMGTTPMSYLNLNLAPPLGHQPSFLTIDDVELLFYEFGHGLQQLLTTIPYSDIGGQRNVEWDVLQVCATVMSMLALHPHTLHNLSGHWKTGEKISMDIIETLLKAHRHMAAYDTMRQLYFAAFDMELYISDDHWHSSMRRVWDQFMPLPQPDEDFHPCSLTAIFSDQYPAAYYSFKWADMIAADIFKAFDEEGLNNPEAVKHIGKRFRETFLSQGGGMPANEVFRRFRGRDPSQEALITLHGLK